MVTLIHKRKEIRTYELSCSIPVKGEAMKVEKSKENKNASGMKAKTERVLTLLPNEIRTNLPDAVLLSPMIKTAIESGFIAFKQVNKVQVIAEDKAEEKKAASSKKIN
ncbi:hypothetical protein MASR1M48_17440 [Lactococcus petauri]